MAGSTWVIVGGTVETRAKSSDATPPIVTLTDCVFVTWSTSVAVTFTVPVADENRKKIPLPFVGSSGSTMDLVSVGRARASHRCTSQALGC